MEDIKVSFLNIVSIRLVKRRRWSRRDPLCLRGLRDRVYCSLAACVSLAAVEGTGAASPKALKLCRRVLLSVRNKSDSAAPTRATHSTRRRPICSSGSSACVCAGFSCASGYERSLCVARLYSRAGR